MKPVVEARPGQVGDEEAIELLHEIAMAEARTQRGGRLLVDFDRFDKGDPSRLDPGVVVGLIDGVVVGFASWRTVERNGIRAATIEALFVHPEGRGVGVGAAILSEIQNRASSQQCSVLESLVLPGNRAAKNFFERLGMVTRKMIVSRPID